MDLLWMLLLFLQVCSYSQYQYCVMEYCDCYDSTLPRPGEGTEHMEVCAIDQMRWRNGEKLVNAVHERSHHCGLNPNPKSRYSCKSSSPFVFSLQTVRMIVQQKAS